jgi:hypothetical protein
LISGVFWVTIPNRLFFWVASSINLIVLDRPIVRGITAPGKKTLFLSGKIGSLDGNVEVFDFLLLSFVSTAISLSSKKQ